ncbi:MAG: hypothetical protein CME70_12645 [Halobacteriovorax sp.]|nr:hypothetical protein [Halobacteriovorax sp.]|tara:strand:+ start:204050 stop:204742 length:693 start_codon:yes stop_codon:yes gene_type:complete
MQFFDSHTHQVRDSIRQSQVLSVDIRKALDQGLKPEGPFCLGIHPWYIDEIVIDEAYELIKEFLEHQHFMSMGEMGLDRKIKVPIQRQLEVFEKQIKLAIDAEVNSLVLHCVRAYPDVLNLIKKLNYRGSLIFHDYNGNPDMTSQLLRYNVFFSYGPKLYDEKSGGFRSFTHIPNHRLLLETDDMEDYRIEDIYEKAANLLNLDLKKLQQIMLENAESAFGKPLPSDACQ